jgi:hypothetical protein
MAKTESEATGVNHFSAPPDDKLLKLADEFRQLANEIQTAQNMGDVMASGCFAFELSTRLDELIAEYLPTALSWPPIEKIERTDA